MNINLDIIQPILLVVTLTYLRAEQPYDCAGSAKCETLGIALTEAIESDDPTALVGLPLIRTCALLPAGFDPLRHAS